MMCLHMGLFLSIMLHSRCVVFLSQEIHIFQSSLIMFIDYFLPFIFSVLVFWNLNYLDVGPSGWVFLFFFPLPFPFFNLSFLLFAVLVYLQHHLLILNLHLGCLSLNLQGLILFFCLVCLYYYYQCSFYLVSCSSFIDAVLSIIYLSLMRIFFKSILFSTWSFFPPVTLTYLLEAFLR